MELNIDLSYVLSCAGWYIFHILTLTLYEGKKSPTFVNAVVEISRTNDEDDIVICCYN